ncbi:hypothetical protein [Myceligenerans salitolerans]|uniref:Uncharacterized protein n=1 Tax=Myceligenerans salitolerans TaxID=1230528 RepID=A0ABS3IFD0_9MICO|nr:hypothetical protein [Myceligenerans salitolerans]MBO0611099.1 hypothetical protein [Myceligenerans salitolerans]
MPATTPPAGRAYDRRIIAAWLHGYDTGHNVGYHDGRRAGNFEGWQAGHTAGHAEGWHAADQAAAAKYRTYLAMSDASRPNIARGSFGEAKPLPSYADCLASWGPPTAARRPVPARVRAAA